MILMKNLDIIHVSWQNTLDAVVGQLKNKKTELTVCPLMQYQVSFSLQDVAVKFADITKSIIQFLIMFHFDFTIKPKCTAMQTNTHFCLPG